MRREYTRLNLTGQQFGRWTVLYEVPQKGYVRSWHCRCACGKEKTLKQSELRCGMSKSCGCYQVEALIKRSTTHGHAHRHHRTPEYRTYLSMHQRCENPNAQQYLNYGARGIAVCERWNTFEAFLEDMGPRPSPKHSLDRFPNKDGNYEPGNVRWATVIEQNNNKRTCRYITFNGETKTLAQWARLTGISESALSGRIARGYSVARALTQPMRNNRRRQHPPA